MVLNTLFKLISPLRKLYWFIFRPKTAGVKCLIECDGRFLMIRNSYGSRQWTFPGGRIKRGESPEAAVMREIREEVGVPILKLKPLGVYCNRKEYKRDVVHCFYALVSTDLISVDKHEVDEAQWFSPQAIHGFRAALVDAVLEMAKHSLVL